MSAWTPSLTSLYVPPRWRDIGYEKVKDVLRELFDHTPPLPLFLSSLPLYSTSLLSLHLPNVPPAAAAAAEAHWGPSSQQAAARCSIMSLIGAMSKMATISKGRKQRDCREEGLRRWREWVEERETERERERLVVVKGGCVHSTS